MIRRVVKMTFQEDKVADFVAIFDNNKTMIRSFKGCRHLELLRDINNPSVFFTFSLWHSQADLKDYKDSIFFKNTWSQTRALFSEKPEAWSLEQLVKEDI